MPTVTSSFVRRIRRLLVLLTLTLPFAACDVSSPESVRVRTELLRASTPDPVGLMRAALRATSDGAGINWNGAFEVESFRTHVTAIWLKNPGSSGGVEVYRCPAQTVDGCMIEMTGPELQNLLPGTASFPLRPGTYSEIQVNFSDPRGSCTTTVELRGSVQLQDGLTYYTKSTGDPLRPEPPSEPVTYLGNGCSRQFALATPLTIVADSVYELPLRLYFDARHMAYGMRGVDASAAWSDDGCKGPMPTTADAPANPCQHFPEVAGTISASPPVIERYRINGAGIVGLFIEGDADQPIGAYALVDYQLGVANSLGFRWGSPYRVERNTDGSYRITMHGAGNGPDAVLPAFQRGDHSGSYVGINGVTYTYTAVRID